MGKLINRVASLIIGDALYEGPRVVDGRYVEGLRFQFTVTRTSKPEPDTLELTLSNLAPETRARIQKGTRIILNAGYADSVTALFVGHVRRHKSKREGSSMVTQLKCGDGDAAYSEASTSVSLAKGATLAQAVTTMADAMGVDATEALARVQKGDIPPQARTYSRGFAANGKASVVLTKMLDRAGLSWTMQNGKLVVLGPNEVVPGQAVLLRYDTGLVESPEPNDSQEDKGPPTTSIRALLQGAILPGVALDVRSEFVTGLFRAQAVRHSGDTHGTTEWYSDIEATAL
jgi:hypothetical protein